MKAVDQAMRICWRPIAPAGDMHARYAIGRPIPDGWNVQFLVQQLDGQSPIEKLAVGSGQSRYPEVQVIEFVLEWLEARLNRRKFPGLCFIDLPTRVLYDEGLSKDVTSALNRGGSLANHICLSLSESGIVTDSTAAQLFSNVVWDVGSRFAMANFGETGRSFRHLSLLRVDFVRLGDEMMERFMANDVGSAMARCVCELCRNFGVQTIAPSIESELVRARLCRAGVDFVQGRLIGESQPLEVLC